MTAWRLVLLLLSFAFSTQLSAIRADDSSATNELVSPVIDPRQVSRHYKETLLQPQYQEREDADTNAQLRDWLSQWLNQLGAEFGQAKYLQQMPRFASLLMTVFVVLALAGLLYVLGRLIRRRAELQHQEFASGGAGTTFLPPEFYAEELRQAVGKSDWRGAWLASWRQLLSRLEVGRLVETDRSRTNREYLAQLCARSLPRPAVDLMARMVDNYDNFIYGRKPIAEPDWLSFQHQIEEATLLLHLQDHASIPAGKSSTP